MIKTNEGVLHSGDINQFSFPYLFSRRQNKHYSSGVVAFSGSIAHRSGNFLKENLAEQSHYLREYRGGKAREPNNPPMTRVVPQPTRPAF
jgi:CRISPR/Cas system CMR-associated protein Cmr3 (group 5 of RAMP superfamily)